MNCNCRFSCIFGCNCHCHNAVTKINHDPLTTVYIVLCFYRNKYDVKLVTFSESLAKQVGSDLEPHYEYVTIEKQVVIGVKDE